MRKHLIFLFFVFLFLTIVSASSFIGSINEEVVDTDGDGLYNYLTIDVGVSIDKTKNHTIYGLLKDSSNNLLEYSKCMNLVPGTYTFSLDFNGKSIYRNKVA